jgi:hypothetical protein
MRTKFGSGLTFEAEASDLLYSVPTASSSEILDFSKCWACWGKLKSWQELSREEGYISVIETIGDSSLAIDGHNEGKKNNEREPKKGKRVTC